MDERHSPSPHQPTGRWKRPLDPIDRLSEVWFGLVMVLTFTCTLSVREAGHGDVHAMLRSALGCNLAWGILDAFMYLVGHFVERGRGASALREVRESEYPQRAWSIIADEMPPLLASVATPAELEPMRQRLRALTDIPSGPHVTARHILGAIGVFLVVFLSTFPVAIPFLLVNELRTALRISNAIALVMLFLTGYAFGRYARYRPVLLGLAMTAVGSVLVAITIVLGG